jgi:hypothetical protein
MLAGMAEKEKLIGTKILIFKFMSNLISQLKNPVIAHQSIFGPIQVIYLKMYKYTDVLILYFC